MPPGEGVRHKSEGNPQISQIAQIRRQGNGGTRDRSCPESSLFLLCNLFNLWTHKFHRLYGLEDGDRRRRCGAPEAAIYGSRNADRLR
jgi:hypothetical protein